MRSDTSRIRRLDLLFPGLGPLLLGEPILGLGRMLLTGTWAAAAVQSVSQGGSAQLFSKFEGWVSVSAWLALGASLWSGSARFAGVIQRRPVGSRWSEFQARFVRNRNGMMGFFGVTWLTTLTLFAPMLAAADPDAVSFGPRLLAPGRHQVDDVAQMFWMGTDAYGRDLFSRVLYGGQISLVIGFIAVSIAATIGASVGATAGYFGGRVDRLLTWCVDLLLSLPSLVLLLAIVGMFQVSGVKSIFLIVTVLGLTSWMGVSRIVRSQVLSLKQQDFVQAARALGFSHARIVFRHLLPNAMAPVIVYCSLAIGAVMLAEASLSFLGLGVPPPTATWGTLVNDGRETLQVAPWIATFPGLFIVLAVMSFNLLGDGLRDSLDPKLRGR